MPSPSAPLASSFTVTVLPFADWKFNVLSDDLRRSVASRVAPPASREQQRTRPHCPRRGRARFPRIPTRRGSRERIGRVEKLRDGKPQARPAASSSGPPMLRVPGPTPLMRRTSANCSAGRGQSALSKISRSTHAMSCSLGLANSPCRQKYSGRSLSRWPRMMLGQPLLARLAGEFKGDLFAATLLRAVCC